jgi:CRISPR-associated protein Cas2
MPGKGSSATTLYVVSYDITNDRRRAKVHAILLGFGTWTQFSLFECFLNSKEVILLQSRLSKAIHHREDTVRLYALCDACHKRVEILGHGELPNEPTMFLV